MADKKKEDLTRLEDIGEFLHPDAEGEGDSTETSTVLLDESAEETPALPPEAEESPAISFEEPTSETPPPAWDVPATPNDTPAFGDETPLSFDTPESEAPSESTFDSPPAFGDDAPAFTSESPFDQTQTQTATLPETHVAPALPDDDFTTVEETRDPTPTTTSTSLRRPPDVDRTRSTLRSIHDTSSHHLEETPIDVPASKPPETFSDIKSFAQSIHYGEVASGGTPPFSIAIKNIVFIEDADDIAAILREHGLLTSDNEDSIQKSLAHGQLLISQISEYAAVYLAHRLRRFHVDILIGLSDDVHPPKSYTDPSRGLVNRRAIHQNKSVHLNLSQESTPLHEILVTTTPTLDGLTIQKYLGIVSEHTVLDLDEFIQDEKIGDSDTEKSDEWKAIEQSISDKLNELESDRPFPKRVSVSEIYVNLAQKLKTHVLNLGGNAIVGVNYNITPLVDRHIHGVGPRYQITCTGNAVLTSRV